MVSTITETCFRLRFEPWGQDRLRSCHWLQLRAANGLEIPYIGYLELDIELCGSTVPDCGVLVVRDPPGGGTDTPGILGMNVLGRCYRELFGRHGATLFELPFVAQDSKITRAFQDCQQVTHASDRSSNAKVRGRSVCRIPGGTLKFVTATCSSSLAGKTVLFEPFETGLPAGLLASPSLVQVNAGTVLVPVVNVGTIDVVLYPTTVIGKLGEVHLVGLPCGLTEVSSVTAQVASCEASVMLEPIDLVDLGGLSVEEQEQVRVLLHEYQNVFSMHEGDLGCTNLLSHEIPLMDDTPVRQRYININIETFYM